MFETCIPHHDWFNALLTGGLCLGLVISYLPQHIRIISSKSSEGLSAVYLFLGTTSAASAMFNMLTLQAPIVKCCRVVSFGSCMEMSLGVIQITLQFVCFGIVFILYMMYYPEHMRYVVRTSEEVQTSNHLEPVRSENWRLSIILAWGAAAHFVITAAITAYLLFNIPDLPSGVQAPVILTWTTYLGVSAALLATIQYAPQLLHTYHLKLVGALSIPMMMIQTPGGILMVISIALRPGTDWTSWLPFLFSAILQGCLLFMCVLWKIRQRKHGIDDFGNPLKSTTTSNDEETAEVYDPRPFVLDEPSSVSELAITPSDDPIIAQEGSIRSTTDVSSPVQVDNEETPLLRHRERPPPAKEQVERGWSAWFGR